MELTVKGKRLNRKLSHMPGVKNAVFKYAKQRHKVATARLNAAKHRTGNSKVVLERGSTDCVVALIDPPQTLPSGKVQQGNAYAIEFGHDVIRGGEVVGRARGLKVITGAFELGA